MPARIDRKNNMAAIELAARQEVQRGRQHSHPGRHGHGMQIESAHRRLRNGRVASHGSHGPVSELEDERKSQQHAAAVRGGSGCPQRRGYRCLAAQDS